MTVWSSISRGSAARNPTVFTNPRTLSKQCTCWSDLLHLHFGGDLSPRLVGLALLCTLVPGRKTVLTFHPGGHPRSRAGRACGTAKPRRSCVAPAGWTHRREFRDRRAISSVRHPPRTYSNYPPFSSSRRILSFRLSGVWRHSSRVTSRCCSPQAGSSLNTIFHCRSTSWRTSGRAFLEPVRSSWAMVAWRTHFATGSPQSLTQTTCCYSATWRTPPPRARLPNRMCY